MPIRFLQVGQNTAEHNRLFGTNNLPLHTFTTIFYTEFLGHQMKRKVLLSVKVSKISYTNFRPKTLLKCEHYASLLMRRVVIIGRVQAARVHDHWLN